MMKINKKYFGEAVMALNDTIIETYNCVGDDDIVGILTMINSAYQICTIWDLSDFWKIEKVVDYINQQLAEDNSKYRIFKEIGYKLVEII